MNFEKQINFSETIFICSNSVLINNKFYFNKIKKKSIYLLSINSKLPDADYLSKKFKIIKNKKFINLFIIGGGKTIDSGKILYTFFLNDKKNIKLFILPTLLGSGAEVTNSAVCFKKNIKKTITSTFIKPKKIFYSDILFNQAPNELKSYSALDCLCQSIESIWSKKSNSLSIKLASESFKNSMLFLKSNKAQQKKKLVFNKLCKASLSVGMAMNITRTTAPHALSYPLTAHLNINHGLAVSLLFKLLVYRNLESLNNYKRNVIMKLFKVKEMNEVVVEFSNILKINQIDLKLNLSKININKFLNEINVERLKNNPSVLTKDYIKYIYSLL